MNPITFNPRHYILNGKPVYLNCGEFHYFRVPRADWRKRMELFKQAGGNCLATYCPWLIHEPEEGVFEFGETRPQLDLEAFLTTARDAGLYVICRPGPYQYSELVYNGLPLWLGEMYPEVKAVNRHGRPLTDPSSCDQISYLHPVFLEKTANWLAKISPVIARHTVHRGGPVAFVQPDNELGGIQVWNGGHDYHPVTMGFGDPEGRYPRFLLQKYGGIDALNAIYGSGFGDIVEVDPRKPELVRVPWLMEKDYFAFYCEHLADYFGFLIGEMERHGVDVPFVHNSANPNMNTYFLETVRRFGDKLLIGSDHYYNLNMNWEQNNPTPQYAVRTLISNEMLRLLGFPPTIFELPGGSLSDWPPITPVDLEACYLTNVALGMKGHNYYIFTGGPNVPGTGNTSDIYDFGAPVGPDNEIRPTYQTVKDFGKFLLDEQWLVESERETDFLIAMPWEYTRARSYAVPCDQLEESADSTWTFIRNGLMQTSLCADLSPGFCDLDSDLLTLNKPIYVPACSYMDQAVQQRVVDLLEAGATLIMGPAFPLLDEFLKPCTVLADYLGLDRQAFSIHRNHRPARPCMGDIVNISNNGAVFLAENLPGEAVTLGVDERSGLPFAWEIGTKNGGRFIFHGMRWFHNMHEHSRMMRYLMTRCGVSPVVNLSNPNLWSSLLTAGDQSILFLMNLYTSPMETTVRCHPAWSGGDMDLGLHKIEPMTVQIIRLQGDQP